MKGDYVEMCMFQVFGSIIEDFRALEALLFNMPSNFK